MHLRYCRICRLKWRNNVKNILLIFYCTRNLSPSNVYREWDMPQGEIYRVLLCREYTLQSHIGVLKFCSRSLWVLRRYRIVVVLLVRFLRSDRPFCAFDSFCCGMVCCRFHFPSKVSSHRLLENHVWYVLASGCTRDDILLGFHKKRWCQSLGKLLTVNRKIIWSFYASIRL